MCTASRYYSRGDVQCNVHCALCCGHNLLPYAACSAVLLPLLPLLLLLPGELHQLA
jgi:hypothetical protein